MTHLGHAGKWSAFNRPGLIPGRSGYCKGEAMRRVTRIVSWLICSLLTSSFVREGMAAGIYGEAVLKGIFSFQVEMSPHPRLARAILVSGGSALEMRCIEGRLSIALNSLGFSATQFQRFDVEFQTELLPPIRLRGLGNNGTSLGRGSIALEDLQKDTLERLRGAKVAVFKVAGSDEKASINLAFLLFAQADEAIDAIEEVCSAN